MKTRSARYFDTRLILVGSALGLVTTTSLAQGTPPAPATPAPLFSALSNDVSSMLAGKSFNIAINYAQATFKSRSPGGRTQITDNGQATPALEISSGENVFRSWPMQTGHIVLGWNIKAAASVFETRYQLVDSAVRGDDVGTSVRGGFLGVAPTVFLKLGPLYPDSEIFWKVGYGIGPGILKSTGTALFTDTSVREVGSSSPKLALYQDGFVQLQINHWQLEIAGKILFQGGDERTSLETYGFGVAYRIGF